MLKWQYFGYIGLKIIKINLCFFFAFFLMWHIFKVFVGFVTILLLFYALVFWPWVMWDPRSPTRDWTHTPCMGRWSLNHWTAMKVPFLFLFTRGPAPMWKQRDEDNWIDNSDYLGVKNQMGKGAWTLLAWQRWIQHCTGLDGVPLKSMPIWNLKMWLYWNRIFADITG